MSEEQNKIDNNNNNIDSQVAVNLAVVFPSWDLLPPDLLLKRGNNENS